MHAAKYRAYLDHYRALFGSDAEAAGLDAGLGLGLGLVGGCAFGPAPADEPVAVLDGTDRVGHPAWTQALPLGQHYSDG